MLLFKSFCPTHACTTPNAKAQLFDVAEDNVKFAEGMKSELEKEGHIVELVYTSRKDTLKNIEQLVVGEELIRLKNETNGTLGREERRQFLSQWKTDNYTSLIKQLGFKTQHSRFFHGVFLTPSFTKTTVTKLQTLIAETLGDPYKGRIPLPSVPYYQARDLSSHLTRTANTPNLNGHEYFPNGNHMIPSHPQIVTE